MDESRVLLAGDYIEPLTHLIEEMGLELVMHPDGKLIPGSYWGDSEAGLIGNQLHIRADTPIHSALHESCHFLCMDDERRNSLHTDAGGDYEEENGVCALQILLADRLDFMGRDRMMADMDAWGYTFRLGSARRWFTEDAEDAFEFLVNRGLVKLDPSASGPQLKPRPAHP